MMQSLVTSDSNENEQLPLIVSTSGSQAEHDSNVTDIAKEESQCTDVNAKVENEGHQIEIYSASLERNSSENQSINVVVEEYNNRDEANTESKSGEETTVEKAATKVTSGKRRGRPPGTQNCLPSLKKPLIFKKGYEPLCKSSWEDLTNHLHERLRKMDSDECFMKALELSMLARNEVENRSQHLFHAFEAITQGRSTMTPEQLQTQGDSTVLVPAVTSSSNTPTPSEWMEKYQELNDFKRTHGHCNVAIKDEFSSLAEWVLQQIQNKSELNDTQKELLNEIGIHLGDESVDTNSNASIALIFSKLQESKFQKEQFKQRQIKMHRNTKYRSVESVPCVKMDPPFPPRCEDEAAATALDLPVFSHLVNFPTARYFGNCVMCDESEFSVPKQNKGVCNNCDTSVWIIKANGLQIKWCKGCKNFRKWSEFGVKGYSSKCENCRKLQAARYAQTKKTDL